MVGTVEGKVVDAEKHEDTNAYLKRAQGNNGGTNKAKIIGIVSAIISAIFLLIWAMIFLEGGEFVLIDFLLFVFFAIWAIVCLIIGRKGKIEHVEGGDDGFADHERIAP